MHNIASPPQRIYQLPRLAADLSTPRAEKIHWLKRFLLILILLLTFSVLFAVLHNFGFQMLLVGEDTTIPLVDCFLFTNPNCFSNLK